MYHSIAESGSRRIRDFVVTPRMFAEHLGVVEAKGYTTMTVSSLVDALANPPPNFDSWAPGHTPFRPLVITFDDGYADFYESALPLMAARDMAATVYVTTGGVRGPAGTAAVERAASSSRRPPPDWAEPMLSWSQIAELSAAGVEVGGHTHTHPELDMVSLQEARWEIATCKQILEEQIGIPIRTFAYPFGYSTARVRRVVREAGFDSACSVKHALSSPADDRLALARLEVRSSTTTRELASWLTGRRVRTAPCNDRLKTRAWRNVRRLRTALPSIPTGR